MKLSTKFLIAQYLFLFVQIVTAFVAEKPAVPVTVLAVSSMTMYFWFLYFNRRGQ